MTVWSHPYISVGRKHATTRSFYAINFVGFIWMHLGMWLHPLFRCQSSIPLAPPLPWLSESSNLLPPLVIYLHCSAIIQVIKTPADRSVFSLHESGSFQCVCETKPHPLFYVFVVGEYACVCIWPSVLRFVVDLDSNVLSFFLSLYLPHATVWHFNHLFLSSSVSF